MKMRYLLGIVLGSVMLVQAQDVAPVIHVDVAPNAVAQRAKHYVVMVSLDGFRYDYAREYGAPNLDAMAADGAWTPEGMLPSYPSITFPNHYTLVTGLRPADHGIVGMEFWDPKRKAAYLFTDDEAAHDGSWYGGVPLWVLAEKQGMRAASFFWPGSEAEIDGLRPAYYMHFDDKFDDALRVKQVLAWLQLPESERPHFITLYYANTDHAGHFHGPDSVETRDAVHHVDEMIGKLRDGLKESGLPVDLIVTADHGMIQLDPTPVVLDTLVDLSHVRTKGPFLYAKNGKQADELVKELRAKADGRFDVYRRKDVPKGLHYESNEREGDPVVVPRAPFNVMMHARKDKPLVGSHGFDPHVTPEMKAIFYAEGPDVKPGVKIESFDNVAVYSFVAKLLGLKVGKTDGEMGPLGAAVK